MNKPKRCPWCGDSPLYQAYHDHEWGKPIFDDHALFALLCLEAMQAGLSWITILKKREHYYQAFDDFNPVKIATYDDAKVEELMQNAGIIRHRAKILAIIANAQAFLKITKNQSFSDYLWGMTTDNHTPIINYPKTLNDIPSSTVISSKLAAQLKKDEFKFLGATTCYAFMQAAGMVNDHLLDCDFR